MWSSRIPNSLLCLCESPLLCLTTILPCPQSIQFFNNLSHLSQNDIQMSSGSHYVWSTATCFPLPPPIEVHYLNLFLIVLILASPRFCSSLFVSLTLVLLRVSFRKGETPVKNRLLACQNEKEWILSLLLKWLTHGQMLQGNNHCNILSLLLGRPVWCSRV